MKKKHWIKGIICFVICLMIGIIYPIGVKAESGSQQVNPDNVVKADSTYYQSLGLAETPTLTVYKHKTDKPDVPVQGVEFKTKKIGDLYQIKTGTTHQMVYGIQKEIASKVGINSGDYTFTDSGQNIIAFKDAKKINEAFQKNENRQKVQNLLNDKTGIRTNSDGNAIFSNLDYGLYVVVETDVTDAKINDKPVSITWQTQPYVVALPSYVDGKWNENVIVNTKNSIDDATLEKKVVTNYHGGTILTTDLETADTDITQGNDVVEFYLKMKIPQIPGEDKEENVKEGSDSSVTRFNINDHASKAYKINENDFKIFCNEVELNATDYQISTSPINKDGYYNNGTAIKIELTSTGLNKITNASKASAKESYLHVYYLASVNNQVVVGPGGGQSGNPNRAQLTYCISNNSPKNTAWDTVTTYTFGFDVLKKLDDQNISSEVAEQVQFVLYSQKNGQKTYYTFENNTNNQYYLTGSTSNEDEATRISPVNESKVSVYGLEEGTYYLEEVKTIDGYHILKEPLEVIITAQKGVNNFVGRSDEYTGLLMQENDNDGIASYEVINTKGFEIPATGGMGVWLFVLGGMSIIVIGATYFYVSGRKKKMM